MHKAVYILILITFLIVSKTLSGMNYLDKHGVAVLGNVIVLAGFTLALSVTLMHMLTLY